MNAKIVKIHNSQKFVGLQYAIYISFYIRLGSVLAAWIDGAAY